MVASKTVHLVRAHLDSIRANGASEFTAWQIRAMSEELHEVSIEQIEQALRRLHLQRYPISAKTGRDESGWRFLKE